MKSAAFAAAAVAAVVSAHEVRSPLNLDLGLGDLIHANLCLGLDVKLPGGISLGSADDCPSSSPPEDCTDVWHPPHHVPMDGCDDNGNHEWHYVHPCDCQAPAPHTWATQTVTQTQVSTIVSCAPTVTNCPAGGSTVTTVIVPATTTVCPVPITSTTLATVPATYTVPASNTVPVSNTVPATQPVTFSQPPVNTNTWTAPATTQAPPNTWTQPGTVPGTQAPPPPPATTLYPSSTAPVVVAPPATTPILQSTTPIIVVPPPVGTGFPPAPGNGTQPPPVMAGATQNAQKVGTVVAMGLVAALLI
ncbi:hypothetical protein QQS21_005275 [Conoideocrella luteorostrata]|uniref:Adhesin-like protein 2 n=1 Tax=Conoideocrella luteorostrata TaxID=1105319 RepID=A0AAJ0CPP3_9HYPO|nr:hypothetical protein QQS21_005275 [Conoideocrella luteorostrata]